MLMFTVTHWIDIVVCACWKFGANSVVFIFITCQWFNSFPSVCLREGREREEIIFCVFLLVLHKMEIFWQLSLIDVLVLMVWGSVSLVFKREHSRTYLAVEMIYVSSFQWQKSEKYAYESSHGSSNPPWFLFLFFVLYFFQIRKKEKRAPLLFLSFQLIDL